MDLAQAAERLLQRQSIAQIAVDYREELLLGLGIRVEDAEPDMLHKEVRQFAGKLCRHVGERHAGDPRVAVALEDWARKVDDYEVFDALLSNFDRFASRAWALRRGRLLFPRAMTEHWGADEHR